MAGNSSYREKSLYGTLAAELLVYSLYFIFILHRQNSIEKIAGMLLAIIGLQIAVRTIIAVATPNRMVDERDQLIELRGYRAGYITIASLMIFGMAMLWFHTREGNFPIHKDWVGLHFLSVFFGMLVISDIVKTVTQILAYRRAV
ncbi:MAG TPA: hypothetical protein VGN16_14725 [Acidobacteriaceae bacterium]